MTTPGMTIGRRVRNATAQFGPLGLASAMLVCLLAVGCAREVTTAGEGAVETQSRATEVFTRIEVSYGIGVTVRIGPAAPLEVSAQPNLLPIISTDVRGGTLRIRGTREFATAQTPHVVIVTPSLEAISLSGGSIGQIDGLDSPQFGIDLGGGSQLTVTGTAPILALNATGSSHAALDELTSSAVVLNLSGASIANLHVSGEVMGNVSGESEATVIGGAQISVVSSGGSVVGRG